MLPTTYTRTGQTRSKSFRAREKFVIALVFLTFCFVCFCGIFLLPEFGSSRVLNVYKQFQRAGPEMFIPAPPIDQPNHHHHQHRHQGIEAPAAAGSALDDEGHVVDRAKLLAKIKEELGDLNLDRPETLASQRKLEESGLAGGVGGRDRQGGGSDVDGGKAIVPPPLPNHIGETKQQQEPPIMKPVPIPKSDDSDVSTTERRNKVREVSVLFAIYQGRGDVTHRWSSEISE